MKTVNFIPKVRPYKPHIMKTKPLDTKQLIQLGVGTIVAVGLIGAVASALKK